MGRLRDWLDWLERPKVVRAGRYLVVVLVALAVISNAFALRYAIHADSQQAEGRRIATATNCAAISAVIDAGRATIQGGTPLPPRLQRELERYGYPTPEERKQAARLAAAAYARSITSRVQEFTGRKDLVEKDGSLDCAKLREEAEER